MILRRGAQGVIASDAVRKQTARGVSIAFAWDVNFAGLRIVDVRTALIFTQMHLIKHAS